MSPIISPEWNLMLVGSALTVIVLGLLFVWALCRAAARADRAMERKVREDNERSGL